MAQSGRGSEFYPGKRERDARRNWGRAISAYKCELALSARRLRVIVEWRSSRSWERIAKWSYVPLPAETTLRLGSTLEIDRPLIEGRGLDPSKRFTRFFLRLFPFHRTVVVNITKRFSISLAIRRNIYIYICKLIVVEHDRFNIRV